MKRLLILGLSSCVALTTACTTESQDSYEQRLYAMATWVDVSIRNTDVRTADLAIREIEAMLREFETDYYAWAPGQLAELNSHLQTGKPVEVSIPLASLLTEAKNLSALSDGFFEPGLGALVELWGFHTAIGDQYQPPTDEQIDLLLAGKPRISSLQIEGQRITGGSADLKIDLGGIAKGAAIDAAIEILGASGISHALVNAGGDLRAFGTSGDSANPRAWRIGIQHPRDDGLLGIIELEDGESAFTSGDYERYYDYQNERLHHILDPRTGRPVMHTQAVTVISDNGATADAAATAIFVSGPDRWREIASALSIDAVLRVDADGSIQLTASMEERLSRVDEMNLDIMLPTDQDE